MEKSCASALGSSEWLISGGLTRQGIWAPTGRAKWGAGKAKETSNPRDRGQRSQSQMRAATGGRPGQLGKGSAANPKLGVLGGEHLVAGRWSVMG